NKITIEGSTGLACSDDVKRRFQGYNWKVLEVDGHDHAAIETALRKARGQKKQPVLIIGHTHIAKGSPHAQDTSESHGSPLGVDEIKATKRALGLPEDCEFYVPDQVREFFLARRVELERAQKRWVRLFSRYRKTFPELALEWDAQIQGQLPADLEKFLPEFDVAKPVATRKASGDTLQSLADRIPQLVGGSADLAPSNNTALKKFASVGPESYAGRNLHFGIREHAMGSVLNGMALHGGWIVYGGTFLVFSDYFKPAIRLASLMHLPVIYVLTHDSIFLGEDGPTHQPVEQLASLRSIPGMTVIRPADASETAQAWLLALRNRKGPTALVLTRQNLPVLDRSAFPPSASIETGAYVLWQSSESLIDIILIASGSEVAVALEAARLLAGRGMAVRLVNMASMELFEKQSEAFKEKVLPSSCRRRLAVEAASSFGWERYVGLDGKILGINRFGASAPPKILAEKYGFTSENIVRMAVEMLKE
ncbi:MAG: transketolase, partial [Lentisphaerota bacterium]